MSLKRALRHAQERGLLHVAPIGVRNTQQIDPNTQHNDATPVQQTLAEAANSGASVCNSPCNNTATAIPKAMQQQAHFRTRFVASPAPSETTSRVTAEHISRRRIWRYRVDGRPARVIDPAGADRDVILRELVTRYGAERVSNLEEINTHRRIQ